MLSRIFQLLVVACLVTTSVWAANDPFVGKWKVNPSKSKITDEMKVEAVGANRYAITFGPGAVDTVVADGSDQPALSGTTLSITVKGPKSWEVVRKMKGRTFIMAHWTLSEDGKTLNDAFTQFQPDGSPTTVHFTYQRAAGSSGFAGTWDSVSAEVDSSIELEIQPYEGDGLSFNSHALQFAQNITFDGKDHAGTGPNVKPGFARSGRRVNQRGLEIANKSEGKITSTQQFELSEDLKTLTMKVRLADEKEPKSIFVFDRE